MPPPDNAQKINNLIRRITLGMHGDEPILKMVGLRFDDEDIGRLCDVLEDDTFHTGLWINSQHEAMPSRHLTGAGVARVAKMLEKNTTITDLQLRQGQCGDDGAVALGNLLAKNTPLEEISITDNELSDYAIAAIAAGIEANTNLKSFRLSNVGISDAGAKRLAQALLRNQTIECVRVYEAGERPTPGCMTEQGVMALNRVLPCHRAMTQFWVQPADGMGVSQEGCDEITDISAHRAGGNLCASVYRPGSVDGNQMTARCEENAARAKGMIERLRKWPDTPIDDKDILKMQAVRPAMRYVRKVAQRVTQYEFDEAMQNLDEALKELPQLSIDNGLTKAQLAETLPGVDYTPTEDPRTWEHFGKLVWQLRQNDDPIGLTDLMQKGERTALFDEIIGHAKVGELFSAENWRGAVAEMRAAYNALPRGGKQQVNNWPRLQVEVSRQEAQQMGLG